MAQTQLKTQADEPANTRQERVQRKEKAIIEAARDMFVVHGFNGTKMSNIARASGVADGTLYTYFQNKEALARAVVADYYHRLRVSAQAGVDALTKTEDRLRWLARHHLKNVMAERQLLEMLTLINVNLEQYENSELFDLNKNYVVIFDRIIKDGQARGDINPALTLWVVRDLFFGSLDYGSRTMMIKKRETAIDTFVDQIIPLIMSKKSETTAETPPEMDKIAQRLEKAASRIETAPWSLAAMPELPEVETVCRGLKPVMEGFVFTNVTLNRPDLRFPFPPDFIERVQGQTLVQLGRRAKFLDAELTSGDHLLMHLGMSGRFSINQADALGEFAHTHVTNPKHDHVIFNMNSQVQIIYNDPRRFGFMELIAPGQASRLDTLGPEPLSNAFNAPALATALKGRKSKIKGALLDQHIVAGLGNIYVCEALYRAGISPKRMAGRITGPQLEALTQHIKDVITEAIAAGGSSLRDFTSADGNLGYFQHRFDVYGQEGKPCKNL